MVTALSSAFAVGETIDGRYRITRDIGAGSMGRVVRADDVFLGRTVALKLLDPHLEDEARALARLRHDNVVQVYAFGVHDGVRFFAMEYVEGDTLQERLDAHLLRGDCLEPRAVSAIIAAVASGLDAVHARGLVHRDVKPANIVLDRSTERPVLVDFGLARRAGGADGRAATGGTPLYIAPEQACDADGTATCAASDLYALAATTFELLTGRPVFERPDVSSLLLAHVREPAPLISTIRSSLAPLDAVLATALEKEPSRRQKSCGAFAAELESAVLRIGSRSMSPSRSSQVRRGRRVLVLTRDEALGRQLVRIVERTLPSAPVRNVATVDELLAATSPRTAAIVVDDESIDGSLGDGAAAICEQIEKVTRARIILVTRTWATASDRAEALRARGIRIVAKPVSAGVLSAVLAGSMQAEGDSGDDEDDDARPRVA